jgi:hypothetical protein
MELERPDTITQPFSEDFYLVQIGFTDALFSAVMKVSDVR